METNCVQQVKPLAARSAACFFTRAANSVRGKCSSDLLNRLATCTIGLPSCGQRLARLPARNCSPTSIIGGHSFYFRLQEPVLDKSDFDQTIDRRANLFQKSEELASDSRNRSWSSRKSSPRTLTMFCCRTGKRFTRASKVGASQTSARHGRKACAVV